MSAFPGSRCGTETGMLTCQPSLLAFLLFLDALDGGCSLGHLAHDTVLLHFPGGGSSEEVPFQIRGRPALPPRGLEPTLPGPPRTLGLKAHPVGAVLAENGSGLCFISFGQNMRS